MSADLVPVPGNVPAKGAWLCITHQREATHVRADGTHCCDPKLGGILLPCHIVSPAKTALTFHHFSAQVINANDSAGSFANMLDVGIKAAAELRARAEKDFRIDIEMGGGLNTEKIALAAYRRFLAIAVACRNAKKPVKELTEEEKFAICVACDVPMKSEGGSAFLLKLETRAKCAIAWEDGQYVVYYAKG